MTRLGMIAAWLALAGVATMVTCAMCGPLTLPFWAGTGAWWLLFWSPVGFSPAQKVSRDTYRGDWS